MSAIPVSPAPVASTAPIAAPARRPAPVRAESSPAFADVLEEAKGPDAPPPAARPRKTDETGSTDTAIKKAADTETEANDDTGAPDLAVVSTPPVVVVPTMKVDVDLAASVSLDEGPPAPPAPAVPAVPAPALPAEAAVAAAAVSAPPPSAAPVAPVAPALPGASAEPDVLADDAAHSDEVLTSEGTLPLLPDASSAAPRLRDRIEQTTTGNAAAAQASPGSAQDPKAESDSGAKTASAPSAPPTPSDAMPAGSKAAADAPSGPVAALDAGEPAQTPQGGVAAEARTAEATAAATSVLSTLSQGAIHATAQIAAQIVKKLEGRSTRFEMALTPDDLGRVDVSLDIDADGQLSARLAFDNPLAAADLRGRVDELRRQLTDAGFTVADDALSFDQREASAGSNGFDRGADPQSGRQSARAFGAASRLSLDAEASLVPPRWMSLTLTPERVDMKV